MDIIEIKTKIEILKDSNAYYGDDAIKKIIAGLFEHFLKSADTSTPPKNPEPPEINFNPQALMTEIRQLLGTQKMQMFSLNSAELDGNYNTFIRLDYGVKNNVLNLFLSFYGFTNTDILGQTIKIGKQNQYNLSRDINVPTNVGMLYLRQNGDVELQVTMIQEANFEASTQVLLTEQEANSNDERSDLPPMPAAPPVETPIKHSEADIVWEKNIRVFFPTNTQYSIEGENRWGNGWTDISLYANSEGFVVNGSQTGQGIYYAAEENSALMYGDNGGVPVNLILNFNDVEEGMTLTFFKLAD